MRRPLRLRTERLTIRVLARGDITEFTRYRNVAAVARYQDWPLPYTRDLAHALVDEMDRVTGPVAGSWVQLAVEHDGVLIGDVAVWLDDAASLAMIGYTLAPEHQGRGYATEAIGAIVEWLFRSGGVHRIAATLDPSNHASARVLERCGFSFVGTARSAALVRGEWADDARYSLLPDEWAAWRSRPTSAPDLVELVEVTSENLRAVSGLDVAQSQRRFVAGVVQSIADAAPPGDVDGAAVVPWYRAIVADGEPVGFLMIARATARHPVTYLWRFFVDHRHQGRGIARRAMGLLAEQLLAAGEERIELSFVDAPGGPEAFYRRLGIVRTGAVEPESGEIVAAGDLATVLERSRTGSVRVRVPHRGRASSSAVPRVSK